MRRVQYGRGWSADAAAVIGEFEADEARRRHDAGELYYAVLGDPPFAQVAVRLGTGFISVEILEVDDWPIESRLFEPTDDDGLFLAEVRRLHEVVRYGENGLRVRTLTYDDGRVETDLAWCLVERNREPPLAFGEYEALARPDRKWPEVDESRPVPAAQQNGPGRFRALLARLEVPARYLELCRRHPGPDPLPGGMRALERVARELGRPLKRNEWKTSVGEAEVAVWFRRLKSGHVEAALSYGLGEAVADERLDLITLAVARHAGYEGLRRSGPLAAPADDEAMAEVVGFVFGLADEAAAALAPDGALPDDTTLPPFDWSQFASDLALPQSG
jgi:hypothetical protein